MQAENDTAGTLDRRGKGRAAALPARLIDVSWIVVLALALVSGACAIAALPSRYRELRADALSDPALLVSLKHVGISVRVVALYQLALMVAVAAVFFAVAAVIARRSARQPMALLVVVLLVTVGAELPDSLRVLGYSVPSVAWLNTFLGGLATEAILLVLWLFPDGRFVPRWTRWLALLSFVVIVLPSVLSFLRLDQDHWPDSVFIPATAALLLSGVLPQIYRYRRLSDVTARQQAKWVSLGLGSALGGYLVTIVFIAWLRYFPGNALLAAAVVTLFVCSALPIPLSFGIAIMRYRLWDIDLVINRTLVYGSLTAILSGLFAALIGLFQKLFMAQTGSHSNLAYVFTTLIVAASFSPIKNGVQNVVDRRFKPVPSLTTVLATASGPAATTQPSGAPLDQTEILLQLAALRADLAARAESEHELREHLARLEARSDRGDDGSAGDHIDGTEDEDY